MKKPSKRLKTTSVLIIGGGFGGVKTALELAKKLAREPTATNQKPTKIRLISDRPHFEYHGALYRLVTGNSPLEVCIPLDTIFENLPVEVLQDKITYLNVAKKQARGESGARYTYDHLVLALGAETSFYNTPGLEKHAFGFKSITEALRLKRHLHSLYDACACQRDNKDQQLCATHLVIVGGGASGTELAAELAVYTKQLAQSHGIDPSLTTIDLIQSPSRLMPNLPKDFTDNIEKKLRSLGVNLYLNRRVIKEDLQNVYLKDIKMKAQTLIWTAGVTGNRLLTQTKTLLTNPKGQAIVNTNLQAKGHPDVYIIGDASTTKYAGMAQTALDQGKFVAAHLYARLTRSPQKPTYAPKPPIYAIPIGPKWAAVYLQNNNHAFYGKLGWTLRRLVDWIVFINLLPLPKAITAFRSHGQLTESCTVCSQAAKKEN